MTSSESEINFKQVLNFIENIDKLKNTYRKCLIMSGEREESTAEHSFSLAMSVLCFKKFSNQEFDLFKAIKMALFHDLAEALIGDTFHYDKGEKPQEMSESEALQKILEPIIDTELAKEIYELWAEFESGEGKEAIFLRGIDRFLPMYHNYKTQGHSWIKHGITQEMALEKNSHIEQSSKVIWEFTKSMLDDSKAHGWIL